MALRMYHYTGQEGIVCRFSIRPPLIVAYKTLVVSRDLKLIKDSHPKYVISMDRLYGQTNIDGIKHIHLRDFLKMTTLV